MRVEIHVTTGPAKGQSFTFDKPARLLFGRSAEAQISLPYDQYVSRQHFLIEITPSECNLSDLNSKNGVLVNGVRYGGQKPSTTGGKQALGGAKEVRLNHGDEIMVGDTRMKVCILPDADAQVDVTDAQPQPLKMRCRLCGKELPDRVGSLPQPAQGAVCPACREKTSQGELKKLMEQALADRTTRSDSKLAAGMLTIKGYQIELELKQGGFGKVYKARELQTGEPVTIKTLRPDGTGDTYQQSAFQREIAIMRQLKHQHIVRFLEQGQIGGVFYLIFEFVEGLDLAKFIQSKGGQVTVADAAPMMLDILDGLAYAHQAKITLPDATGQSQTFTGIVHRNLKPQNILLTQQGERWTPKIADFGLSKTFEAAGLTGITTPGDVFGTPVYWPREQITHYRYLTPASDVFAIAAVFYEMLTGTWVREGFNELSLKYKALGRPPAISDYLSVIAANPPIPIRQRQPNIPEPLAQVIDQALRETEIPSDPHEMQAVLSALRYPDAGAFRNALIQALKKIALPEALPTVLAKGTSVEKDAAREQPARNAPLAEAIMYSTIQRITQKDVALLVLDLAESTQYLLNKGDTAFSTLIGSIFRRIKAHASAGELLFLKCQGDGYLAVFQTMPAAYALALTFLETSIHPEVQVRIALHWGTVKISPEGDVLGTEISRVSQIEGVSIQDRVAPAGNKEMLPAVNRILATTAALKRLDDNHKARFRSAGKFQLHGFDNVEQLWLLHA